MAPSRLQRTSVWIATILISLIAMPKAQGALPSSKPASTAPSVRTEVVIIGTVHGLHLKSPTYSPEVLREILRAVKPSAILNELPLDMVEANGRPKDRGYDSPENWAADQVASELNIPQIPFDRPDRQQYFARTRYFQRQDGVSDWRRKWLQAAEEQGPGSIDLACAQFVMEMQGIQGYFLERPLPEFINSDVHDRLIYLKHVEAPPRLLAIFKKSPDFTPQIAADMAFLEEEWLERNAIMARNIEKAAGEYPGRRVVVVTGAEHRYVLRNLLREKERIILKEYWQVADVDLRHVPRSQQRMEWEDHQHRLLSESDGVCRDYWQAVSRGDWEGASRSYPACSAQQLLAGFSGLLPITIVRIENTRPPEPNDGTSYAVTVCVIKFGDGRTREIKMGTGWAADKCVILATLGSSPEVRP